jgi:hypothetical protein
VKDGGLGVVDHFSGLVGIAVILHGHDRYAVGDAAHAGLGIAHGADDAPTLTPLINRRRPVETVLGTKTAAASESIYSNLAVPFRHFELRGIVASGKHLYRPPTQTAVTTSNFRSTVTVLKTEIPESDQYEIVFYG